MQIAILGRQPELGVAELERVYGSSGVQWFSDNSAIVETDPLNVNSFGGSQKTGTVIFRGTGNWHDISKKVIENYQRKWSSHSGKITLGISAYGFTVSSREVQKTGIVLKSKLKHAGVSLRLVPNDEPSLSSASSHHNKLGLSENKVELLIVRNRRNEIAVAESTGAQNITALARRDQGRPKRDAFVGMLPPKLATMMVNLAAGQLVDSKWDMVDSDTSPSTTNHQPPTLLDPFCGTGVLLQEAALLGYSVYGTDISERMIDYSRANLDWLAKNFHTANPQPPAPSPRLHPGDATDTTWQPPIDLVATETYLGQPFSAPPSPAKLKEVRQNCNTIIAKFLKNISGQIKPGTPLCLAIPAWRSSNGRLTHLPLVDQLESFGYKQIELANAQSQDLIYYREDQIVARQLLILEKM